MWLLFRDNSYFNREMAWQQASVKVDGGILGTQYFYFSGTVGFHHFVVQYASLNKHPQSGQDLQELGTVDDRYIQPAIIGYGTWGLFPYPVALPTQTVIIRPRMCSSLILRCER